jgi:hypothetical protein
MIFIDFWNFSISLEKMVMRDGKNFLINWFKVPESLTGALNDVKGLTGCDFQYQHCHVVGSYGPNDVKLLPWVNGTLSRVPGIKTHFLPRHKLESGPVCTGPLHHEVSICPECKSPMLGYKEKGVDTAIVTLMIQNAWEGLYDLGILVSSDKDFIPAIEYLDRKGVKFIQAGFKGSGYELRLKSWAYVEITDFYEQFRRKHSFSA